MKRSLLVQESVCPLDCQKCWGYKIPLSMRRLYLYSLFLALWGKSIYAFNMLWCTMAHSNFCIPTNMFTSTNVQISVCVIYYFEFCFRWDLLLLSCTPFLLKFFHFLSCCSYRKKSKQPDFVLGLLTLDSCKTPFSAVRAGSWRMVSWHAVAKALGIFHAEGFLKINI